MKKINLIHIALSGLFIALSIILTRVLSFNMFIGDFKIVALGIGIVPIILSGFISGPFYGLCVGGLADIVGYFVFPVGGAYIPPITLTSALCGFAPGLFRNIINKIYKKDNRLLKFEILSFTVTFAVQIISSLLNSLWISIWAGKGFFYIMLPRIIGSVILFPVVFILVYAIYNLYSKTLKNQL